MSEVKSLMFVFDRMPDQDGCTFIEVENADGESVCAGEWRHRDDGLVELVVPINYATNSERLRADTAEAEVAKLRERHDTVKCQRNDAKRSLATAEQSIAELKDLLLGALPAVKYESDRGDDAGQQYRLLVEKIAAALNPKPEAGSHE